MKKSKYSAAPELRWTRHFHKQWVVLQDGNKQNHIGFATMRNRYVIVVHFEDYLTQKTYRGIWGNNEAIVNYVDAKLRQRLRLATIGELTMERMLGRLNAQREK